MPYSITQLKPAPSLPDKRVNADLANALGGAPVLVFDSK